MMDVRPIRTKADHKAALKLVSTLFDLDPAPRTPDGNLLDVMSTLGAAEVSEREGSRVAVVLFEEVRVFHRPHPSPTTDKGGVACIRKWLEQHGVEP